MAYFEYGYVNTDYDTDSASPPVASEYNTIVNIVYSTKSVVSEKIVNFNYDVASGVTENSICNFNNTVFSDLSEKISNLNNSITAEFENNKIDILNDIYAPIFEHSTLDLYLNIGIVHGESDIFIIRKNEDD